MALDNLISISFTDAELTAIDDALTIIEAAIRGKMINLTPDERKQYGRIGNRTENWVVKNKGHMDRNPTLIPGYVSKPEFDKDYKTRRDIEPRLSRLAVIYESLDDTQKLISTDIYHTCLAFYNGLKLASKQNVPGSTVIFADLKAQFPGPGNAGSKDSPAPIVP
jgi:hypothetical protein